MGFRMDRAMVSVHAIIALDRIYTGTAVPLRELSKESKLSLSYLEQIFSKLLSAGIVRSQRGRGGGYILRDGDISVSDIIRIVGNVPSDRIFEPIIEALDSVLISQLGETKEHD